MPDIELTGLIKRYAAVTAVDHLTAQVSAGRITAFLGANGFRQGHHDADAARTLRA